MSDINSVRTLLDGIRRGDESAATKLYLRYERRLIALARQRLGDVPKRQADERDIVNSACKSFFKRIRANQSDQLDDQDDLWRLLREVTLCKCWDHIERELRTRRKAKATEQEHEPGGPKRKTAGLGRVVGESTLGHPAGAVRVMEQVFDREPSALEVTTFMELLTMLPDDLRQIAQWKLDLLSNREIAERLDTIPKRVDRQVDRIRAIWTKVGFHPAEHRPRPQKG